MFLAEKTVKNYVSHLLAKLGMQRRTQAAILATELRRAGDLEPGRWTPPGEQGPLRSGRDTFGFGRWWKTQPIVARNRWLI